MNRPSPSSIERRTFLTHTAGALAAMAIMPEVLPAAVRRSGAPLAVGVIGIGRQGRAILGELQKLDAVKVAAVCDTDSARLEAGVKRTQGAQGYADHKQLLDKAKDVQALFIATPTHLHKQIALDAMAAGRHVYCEAPMASTIDDCKAIAAAAKGAKSVFHVGLEGRSDPIYTLARTFFRSDSVRDLISMRGQHHQKTTWRTPASDPARDKMLNWRLDKEVSIGLPGELGTQQFDVFNWYRSDFPVRVSGAGSIRLHKDGREIPDTIHCELVYADGAMLHYDATLCNSFQGRHEIFCGSNAAIKLAWNAGWLFKEADAPTQGWEVYANRQQFHNDEGITLIADATKLASQGKLKEGVGLPNSPLYYAIGDFLRSVLEGKPAVATAADGLRSAAVGILAHQAVMSGQAVAIDQSLKGM
jgi:predicted dehydrogenase